MDKITLGEFEGRLKGRNIEVVLDDYIERIRGLPPDGKRIHRALDVLDSVMAQLSWLKRERVKSKTFDELKTTRPKEYDYIQEKLYEAYVKIHLIP